MTSVITTPLLSNKCSPWIPLGDVPFPSKATGAERKEKRGGHPWVRSKDCLQDFASHWPCHLFLPMLVNISENIPFVPATSVIWITGITSQNPHSHSKINPSIYSKSAHIPHLPLWGVGKFMQFDTPQLNNKWITTTKTILVQMAHHNIQTRLILPILNACSQIIVPMTRQNSAKCR